MKAHNPPTPFKILLDACGVSQKGGSMLLSVSLDNIKNWYYGRSQPPIGVLKKLRDYQIHASEIFDRK